MLRLLENNVDISQ